MSYVSIESPNPHIVIALQDLYDTRLGITEKWVDRTLEELPEKGQAAYRLHHSHEQGVLGWERLTQPVKRLRNNDGDCVGFKIESESRLQNPWDVWLLESGKNGITGEELIQALRRVGQIHLALIELNPENFTLRFGGP